MPTISGASIESFLSAGGETLGNTEEQIWHEAAALWRERTRLAESCIAGLEAKVAALEERYKAVCADRAAAVECYEAERESNSRLMEENSLLRAHCAPGFVESLEAKVAELTEARQYWHDIALERGG
jgi:hypothetical protein